MAISRLLFPRPALHFRYREFLKSRRFFTSSPSPSSNSSGGDDKPDIRERLGIVPEEKHTGNKVGRSWVKGILTNIKEKLLWVPSEKYSKDETSNSAVNMKVSEDNMIQDDPHDTDCQGHQNASQIRTNSDGELGSGSTCSTSLKAGQNTTEEAISMDTSKNIQRHKHPYSFEHVFTKMHTPADKIKLFEPRKEIQSSEVLGPSVSCDDGTLTALISDAIGEGNLKNAVGVEDTDNVVNSEHVNSKSTIECSGAVVDALADKKGVSRTPASAMIMEITSLEMDHQGKLSDNSEKVKPKKKHEQREEVMSGSTVACGIDQMSGTEDFSPIKLELKNETSRKPSKDGNRLHSRDHENHQIDVQMPIYTQGPKSNTKVRKRLAQSNSPLDFNIADTLLTKLNVQTDVNLKVDKTVVRSDSSIKGRKGVEKLDVKDLVNHVKVLPREQSTTTTTENGVSSLSGLFKDTRSMGRIPGQAGVQSSEVKIRLASSKDHATSKENKKVLEKPLDDSENGERMNTDTNDQSQSKPDDDSPVQSCSQELKRSHSSSMEEGSEQNKVLVRFLEKDAKKDAITLLFHNCGAILRVEEIFSSKASKFKDLLVQFKKRKGYLNALKKTADLQVENNDVLVQPVCSSENMIDTISIPELIGDLEAPVELLRNPLKTVKVTQSSEISIHQLENALAFCQSSITDIFLGSSSYVAYVEFKTEDAKERAIAKHTVNSSGKHFHIFRIDAPMTTVARISNIAFMDKIQPICKKYGEIKCIKYRNPYIADVHFKFAEWTNMLSIINSLNGMEVDGSKWVVQPAPVFSPEVLHSLWSQPEGRRYLRSTVLSLLRKIQKPFAESELTELGAYYGCV